MRLLSLSFPLAIITALVSGAPTGNTNTNTQTVTIQRFPLAEASNVQNLTDATSKFKAASGGKIEHAFLGIVSGTPDVAEQVFLWKSPDDSSSVDTTKAFLPFSSTGAFTTHATAVMTTRDTLLRALNAPITETVVGDILPEVNMDQFEEDWSTLLASLRGSELGVGENYGVQTVGETRTLLVVNGWASEQAPADWIAGQDEATAAAFGRFVQSFVGGPVPMFKHLVEVA